MSGQNGTARRLAGWFGWLLAWAWFVARLSERSAA
jgi:hypothetical protein